MEQEKKRAIEAFSRGCSWQEASTAAGVGRTTLWRWSKKDPEFAEAIKEACGTPDVEVEAVTYANCIDPDPANNVLRMFWLKSRMPNVYQDRAAQHHSGGITIQHSYLEAGLPPSSHQPTEGGECGEAI